MMSDDEVELFGGNAVIGDRPDTVHLFLTGELTGHPEQYIDMVDESDIDIENYDEVISEMGKRDDVTTVATMTPGEAVEVAIRLLQNAHDIGTREVWVFDE